MRSAEDQKIERLPFWIFCNKASKNPQMGTLMIFSVSFWNFFLATLLYVPAIWLSFMYTLSQRHSQESVFERVIVKKIITVEYVGLFGLRPTSKIMTSEYVDLFGRFRRSRSSIDRSYLSLRATSSPSGGYLEWSSPIFHHFCLENVFLSHRFFESKTHISHESPPPFIKIVPTRQSFSDLNDGV